MINDPQNFHQRILFDGMGCTPTDIDAALEYNNKTLILYELKYGDARIKKGQLLILTRIVDAWQENGKQAVLFICRHKTKSGTDVLLKDALVTDVYYQGKLHRVEKPKTAERQTKDFLRFAEVLS